MLRQKTYDNYPFRRIELLRELLNVLERTSESRVASWALTMETKTKLHIRPEDSENLIDTLRGIEGVIVAVFFEELKDGTIRISMRSKSTDADVCKICRNFGGGGHSLAAGARTEGSLDEVRKAVLNHIHQVLEHGEY